MSLGGRIRFRRRAKGRVVPDTTRVFELKAKISAADWAEFLEEVKKAAKKKGISIKRTT